MENFNTNTNQLVSIYINSMSATFHPENNAALGKCRQIIEKSESAPIFLEISFLLFLISKGPCTFTKNKSQFVMFPCFLSLMTYITMDLCQKLWRNLALITSLYVKHVFVVVV